MSGIHFNTLIGGIISSENSDRLVAPRSAFANLRSNHSRHARPSTTGKPLIRAVSLLRNVFWVRAGTEIQGHVAQSGQSVGLLIRWPWVRIPSCPLSASDSEQQRYQDSKPGSRSPERPNEVRPHARTVILRFEFRKTRSARLSALANLRLARSHRARYPRAKRAVAAPGFEPRRTERSEVRHRVRIPEGSLRSSFGVREPAVRSFPSYSFITTGSR